MVISGNFLFGFDIVFDTETSDQYGNILPQYLSLMLTNLMMN